MLIIPDIKEAFMMIKLKLTLLLLWCAIMALSSTGARAESSEVFSSGTGTKRDIFRLEKYRPLYFITVYDPTLRRHDRSLQDFEVQFQLSFKIPILAIPYANGRLAFGYTQVSYWQFFNVDNSAPFRETNYAPEFMASFEHYPEALGLTQVRTTFAAIHESNGRGVPESRSWNRLYAECKLDWERFTLGVRPWYRIPESGKQSPTDAKGDDNPDITRYMGYGEVAAQYRASAFTVMLTGRNNLRGSPNYGSVQLDISIPTKNDFQFYIQAFDGYGDNLIDYNRTSSRVGAGVLIGVLP